jgi:hypothetical protein
LHILDVSLDNDESSIPLIPRRDLRHGPFVFNLTDLHQSNILVDLDWHIKCLIDLEWGLSSPIEMLHPPRWLTNEAVDTIVADEYNKIRQEFMAILEEEEASLYAEDPEMTHLSAVMNQGWEGELSGTL